MAAIASSPGVNQTSNCRTKQHCFSGMKWSKTVFGNFPILHARGLCETMLLIGSKQATDVARLTHAHFIFNSMKTDSKLFIFTKSYANFKGVHCINLLKVYIFQKLGTYCI
jgi:hypothetical protein